MNISALNNLTPYTINNSLINNSQDIGANLITNANTQTGGYLGLGIMIMIFLALMLITMAESDVFRFNFVQSLIISSGFSTLVGIIGIVTGIFTSFAHVMWFATILAIALVAKYYQNNQGG